MPSDRRGVISRREGEEELVIVEEGTGPTWRNQGYKQRHEIKSWNSREVAVEGKCVREKTMEWEMGCCFGKKSVACLKQGQVDPRHWVYPSTEVDAKVYWTRVEG